MSNIKNLNKFLEEEFDTGKKFLDKWVYALTSHFDSKKDDDKKIKRI